MFDFKPTPPVAVDFSTKNSHLTTAHACPNCNRGMSHFFSKKNKRKMLVCRSCNKMYDTKSAQSKVKEMPKGKGDVTKDFAIDDHVKEIPNDWIHEEEMPFVGRGKEFFKTPAKRWTATIPSAIGDYKFTAGRHPGGNHWGIVFHDPKGNDEGMTGGLKGGAVPVMSHMLSAMHTFIGRNKPASMAFESHGISRNKVYKKAIDWLTKKHGYETAAHPLETNEGQSMYYVLGKEPVKQIDDSQFLPKETQDFASTLDPMHIIGNAYKFNPAKWGHVPFTFTGLHESTGRAMFSHPTHGNATMGIDQFNPMKPFVAPTAPKVVALKPTPIPTPASTVVPSPASQTLLDKFAAARAANDTAGQGVLNAAQSKLAAAKKSLIFKNGKIRVNRVQPPDITPPSINDFEAEVTQSITSPVLPGGPTSEPIKRTPAGSPRLKTEMTKTNNKLAGDRNLRIDSGKLANHMSSMMAHAQDPHSTMELPAFHDSFEAMHRHPAPMVKAAFAQAFPSEVANGKYPVDGTEAASRYQRLVGEHLYKGKNKMQTGSSGPEERQHGNEPFPDLEDNLSRMRHGEKFHGRPWIQSLLKNLENSHPSMVKGLNHPEGMTPYSERLEMLKNGSLSERNLKMLLNKMHKPYGSVSMDDLYKHVLPQLGYDPMNHDSDHGMLHWGTRKRIMNSAEKDAPEDAAGKQFQEEDKKQVAKWAPILSRGNRFIVNGVTYHPRFGGRSGKEVNFVPLHERDNPASHIAEPITVPWNDIPEFVRKNHKGNDAMFDADEPVDFSISVPGIHAPYTSPQLSGIVSDFTMDLSTLATVAPLEVK